MAEEIYVPGSGENLTAAQTVQTQNLMDLTIAGNSASSGAGFALISSGTMTFVGGNNITLTQNGNRVAAGIGVLPTYANNAAALAGGLTAGQFFKVDSGGGEYVVHVVV